MNHYFPFYLRRVASSVLSVEGLLNDLNEQQRLAVTTNADHLRVLAGAGSGKTRVLTRRIAHQAYIGRIEAGRTLALTFTRKAAGELRDRLQKLGIDNTVTAGTFHAQAFAQLRSRWNETGIRPPMLLERRSRLMFRILPQSLTRADKISVISELDWATARRITPEQYGTAAAKARRSPPVTPTQLAEYYSLFIEEKKRRQLVDFDDLLELCIDDLGDPTYAATRHWRYQHLFVDEFQDVNPLQFDLLRSWVGPHSTICIVGDPNQAIYSWNGADSRFLNNFSNLFSKTETVNLTDNFRSTPQILAAAAAVRDDGGKLRANRPNGPLPSVQRCDNELHEARSIARRIRDRHKPGGRWSHQAVLVRTNAQTTVIAEALRKAKIAVSVKEGTSILNDVHIRDRLHELASTPVPLATALNDLLLDAQLEENDDVRESLDILSSLAEMHLSGSTEATSTEFVAWIRATIDTDGGPETGDAVEVMTFHAAKGLEWPIVHLAGIEEGLVPIARATTIEASEEEVRLLYVAITRAQDELHCSWAGTRRFGQQTLQRKASPLLNNIVNAGPTFETQTSHQDDIGRVRKIREQIGADETTDKQPLIHDQIRTWRLSTARSSGVPSYAVLDDATLDAIATHHPSTHEELEQIPGLGMIKARRYGAELLKILRKNES